MEVCKTRLTSKCTFQNFGYFVQMNIFIDALFMEFISVIKKPFPVPVTFQHN